MHINWQNKKKQFATMYHEFVVDNIDEVIGKRIKVPKEIERDKAQIALALTTRS